MRKCRCYLEKKNNRGYKSFDFVENYISSFLVSLIDELKCVVSLLSNRKTNQIS